MFFFFFFGGGGGGGFSAPPYSDGETLHVAYEKYEIKRKLTFFSVNAKHISSRELETSEFSLVLHTRENSDVFNTLDEKYLVFTQKKVNILYLSFLHSGM